MPLKTDMHIGKPAPLILFLHGSGERGKEDGSELSKVRSHGPWHPIGSAPFFILAPQCPKGRVWPALVEDVMLVLKDVCEKHRVDRSRVYITGLSMGAFGAWSLAVKCPETFAAIVSVCGGFIGARVPLETSRTEMLTMASSLVMKNQRALKKCDKLPVWFFHGMKDSIVPPKCSQCLYEALEGWNNKNLHMTIFRNAGHACWGKVYDDLDMYTWLLEKKLRIQ